MDTSISTETTTSTENTPLMNNNIEYTSLHNTSRNDSTLSQWKKKIRYYIPILTWLPTYTFKDLKFDIIAGMTMAFILIPQGLSYAATLLKIDPIYGLYSCLIPIIIYSLLGTSRQISIGPEAVVAILVGSTITEYIRTNQNDFKDKIDEEILEERANISFLISAIAGFITLTFGIFRLGFLDSVLSRALLSGFTSAVAAMIFFEQSPLLLGIKVETEEELSPLNKFLYVIENIDQTKFASLYISLAGILFLLVIRFIKANVKGNRIIQGIPEILFLVITSIILSWKFNWNKMGVEILGPIKEREIKMTSPSFSMKKINGLFIPSVLVSIIGFVEAIVVAKKYSAKYKYSVSPNRELVAFGTANIIGSFFCSFPTFGSLSRSTINDRSGAKTQISGLVCASIIFITIKYFLSYFQYLPLPIMASIIFIAALGLIELEDILFFIKIRSVSDVFLMLLVFFTTIFFSITIGILISVSLSLLLVVKHNTQPRLSLLGKYKVVDQQTGVEKFKFRSIKKHHRSKFGAFKKTHRSNIKRSSSSSSTQWKNKALSEVEQIDGVLIISIDESLFFGNTGQLKERLRRIEIYGQVGIHPSEDPLTAQSNFERRRLPIQEIIFDFEGVLSIDACAIQIFTEVIDDYHERGIGVSIVKLNDSIKKKFKNSGLYGKIDSYRYFDKIRDCLNALSYLVPGLPNGVNWQDSNPSLNQERENDYFYLNSDKVVEPSSWNNLKNSWKNPIQNYTTPLPPNGISQHNNLLSNEKGSSLTDTHKIDFNNTENVNNETSSLLNNNIWNLGTSLDKSENNSELSITPSSQNSQSNHPNYDFDIFNNANVWEVNTQSSHGEPQ